MKKTKIIVTYGPAIATKSKITELVAAGANTFRINCSHGETRDFLDAAALIREATRDAPFPVSLLFDISGPKLRLDRFEGEYPVRKGDVITLVDRGTDLSKGIIGVNHPEIIECMKVGERIYIDDGNLVFGVAATEPDKVLLKAGNGGVLLPGKGINLPDSDIGIPTITPKDERDIGTAMEAGADFIALSFVRSGADIRRARELIERGGGTQKIIAKLEKREAIEALDEIIPLGDGVMIARGDLGVELDLEEVPRLQRKIIALANTLHKPVIVATQMLESMRFAPRATRAEVNDVASAVFDYADAVMLSAETATGRYPIEAVKTMTRIIEATEPAATPPPLNIGKEGVRSDIPLSIADAVRGVPDACDIRLILAFTMSGFTAEMISNLFPREPIIALTPDRRIMRQLSLVRSVYPIEADPPRSLEDLLATVSETCSRYGLTRRGDRVVITGGAPFGKTKLTNFMMIHEMT